MAMVKLTSSGGIPQRPDDQSNHRHRQLIGHIGLWLPFILIGIVLWRDGADVWERLESVSAYYYTGAVAAFVGMLVALALFLVTYQGYKNKYHWADRWCAGLGALAAAGVAFFPTAAPDGMTPLPWWKPWLGVVHHVSAIVLFGIFAVYCLWLFRVRDAAVKSDDGKQTRNNIYLGCGLAILGCMVWAGINASKGDSIFWPESWALIAFAISWLVKGYAARSAVNLARSLFTPKADLAD